MKAKDTYRFKDHKVEKDPWVVRPFTSLYSPHYEEGSMVSTLIKQIAKTWMHTLKSVQNKSICSRVKQERRKNSSPDWNALQNKYRHCSYKGSDCLTLSFGQTEQCSIEQGFTCLNGPDCLTGSKLNGSDNWAEVCHWLGFGIWTELSDPMDRTDIPVRPQSSWNSEVTWTRLSDPTDRINISVTSNLKWHSGSIWTGLSDWNV